MGRVGRATVGAGSGARGSWLVERRRPGAATAACDEAAMPNSAPGAETTARRLLACCCACDPTTTASCQSHGTLQHRRVRRRPALILLLQADRLVPCYMCSHNSDARKCTLNDDDDHHHHYHFSCPTCSLLPALPCSSLLHRSADPLGCISPIPQTLPSLPRPAIGVSTKLR